MIIAIRRSHIYTYSLDQQQIGVAWSHISCPRAWDLIALAVAFCVDDEGPVELWFSGIPVPPCSAATVILLMQQLLSGAPEFMISRTVATGGALNSVPVQGDFCKPCLCRSTLLAGECAGRVQKEDKVDIAIRRSFK